MFRKQKKISELKPGEAIEDVFVVKIKKAIFPYKNNTSYAFELLLSDNSGQTINYKFWGGPDETEVKEVYNKIWPDSVILIKGFTKEFQNKLEISSNDPLDLTVLEEGMFDVKDFIPGPKRSLDEMLKELKEHISQMEDLKLKEFLEWLLDEKLLLRLLKHPAAIEIHQNRIGGLMEHILEMIAILKTCCVYYPNLNKDLLVCGAILHDIGKLDELEMTTRIKGSVKGQLIGHIILGSSFVMQKMEEFKLDEELQQKILHMVVSHHGRFEYGSPKEPMTLEAFALYYSDEMSTRLSEITAFIENSKDSTQDDFMYNRRHQRNIHLR